MKEIKDLYYEIINNSFYNDLYNNLLNIVTLNNPFKRFENIEFWIFLEKFIQ